MLLPVCCKIRSRSVETNKVSGRSGTSTTSPSNLHSGLDTSFGSCTFRDIGCCGIAIQSGVVYEGTLDERYLQGVDLSSRPQDNTARLEVWQLSGVWLVGDLTPMSPHPFDPPSGPSLSVASDLPVHQLVEAGIQMVERHVVPGSVTVAT